MIYFACIGGSLSETRRGWKFGLKRRQSKFLASTSLAEISIGGRKDIFLSDHLEPTEASKQSHAQSIYVLRVFVYWYIPAEWMQAPDLPHINILQMSVEIPVLRLPPYT